MISREPEVESSLKSILLLLMKLQVAATMAETASVSLTWKLFERLSGCLSVRFGGCLMSR